MSLLLAQCAGAPRKAPAPAAARVPIVALNDFHGALYEVPTPDGRAYGGLPWIAGALDVLRLEEPNLILLDGGDLFQGSWPVNATRGRGAVEAFNLLGVDATCVGNHEFDYGPGGPGSHPLRGALEEAASTASFAWLTANVEVVGADGEARPWVPEGFARWTLLERAGVKIGVAGLSTRTTPETTLPTNVEDLRFTDGVEALREVLPEMRAAGAEVIVVVGHLTGTCRPEGDLDPPADCRPDEEIGQLLDGLPRGSIDLLVLGHEHVLTARRVDDTFILSSGARGLALGRVDLVVGPDGVDRGLSAARPHWMMIHDRVDPGCDGGDFPLAPISVGGRLVAPSSRAMELIGSLEAETGSLCDPIGCSARFMDRSFSQDSDVGSLAADALMKSFADVDVALQNSGGLRAGLPAGVIRREQVHALMPFENRAVLLEMTGEELRFLLRLGSSGAHGVLQVAGARYRYDPERTTGDDLDGDGQIAEWERDRLCSATVGGEPLDSNRTYRVVVNDFLFAGGDHLGPAFAERMRVETGPSVRESLAEHIRNLEGCLGENESPAEARITAGPCR